MLLSMYASYYWARTGKKSFILGMAVSIVLISFLSAFFPVSIAIIFTFPLTFLSFPFYAHIDPIWTEGWYWVDFLRIRFLTVELTPSLPLVSGRFLVAFPFFLFVNFVGTSLGYWISRKLAEGSWIEKVFNFSFEIGAISYVVCYVTSFANYMILGLLTGYRLNHYLNNHTQTYAIANAIFLVCTWYFWVPAVTLTTIYGIDKWFSRRRE